MARVFSATALLLLSSSLALSAQTAAPSAFANQTQVKASLKSSITSKNAKVDQPIAANVEGKFTVGSLTVDRGSTLTGHVVSVTKHEKGTPGQLVIVFDQIKPKKGDPVAIIASVYQILPSENMMLAAKTDVSQGGMRGSGADTTSTAALRQNTDQQNRTVSGMQSSQGGPIQVVSAIPGVALSAVASGDKSALMQSANGDVELPASMDMVIGVQVK